MNYSNITIDLAKFEKGNARPKQIKFSASQELGVRESDGEIVTTSKELIEKNPTKAMHPDCQKSLDALIPHFALIMGIWRPKNAFDLEDWYGEIMESWTPDNHNWLPEEIRHIDMTEIAWGKSGIKMKADVWIPIGTTAEFQSPEIDLQAGTYDGADLLEAHLDDFRYEILEYIRGRKFLHSEFVQLSILDVPGSLVPLNSSRDAFLRVEKEFAEKGLSIEYKMGEGS